MKRPHYDRNKNPIHRFAAINKLMGAQIGRQEITEDDVDDMEIVVLAAVECISKGHGSVSHYNEIAHVLNQSWVLATERGTGEEAKPYLLVAQDAMNRMVKRFKKTGKFRFDGLGLEAVRRAIELWSHQIQLCTLGEVHAAGEIADKHFWNTPAEAA
ncbi:hypothetical protein [Paraburkholderia sp. J11-2]|uniref:hypothetical protein n=1 Tax=Paraburkholderia sp. J11-2 TaxID=2805431 RepID=UPI002AB767ED|nr:hypothetical protein [Paraburkholderia sp. J11-2]